ncbi:type I-F CRISPR-associated endoribonuclease Cas6/Csy4 [Actinobacillus pleuropneumoniae]|uniref:type I-F CRISPR-associated endoribonuclease Cas6/Csy4 n=1 Tax=Actinobacillus pleuropneumoniae TaxID=715 RepID=UPI0001E49912|nr:type I-F CRISPR-associated endoribonuclease Cas6/Csy4 [Actinobacillus pleuropneumoniae]EFM97156.1 Csy4 family CRISPR-associated protein [Actinobacillus pleuropneumoniae serovar 10 str. D13039]UKH32106.1 type I-F CRISPR-associated endoribonuclease Cas6/Csy4 [Actinobacillus pleuropneumoniae serovar 10 str. D13039]
MSELTHYIELKAIPQVDILQTDVIAHGLQILHKFLPLYQGEIGLSFPAYGLGRTLGGIIRVFGNEQHCAQIKVQLTAEGLQDYALITSVTPIPEEIAEHRRYQRVHRKGQSAIRRTEKFLVQQGKWTEEIRQEMLIHQQNQKVFPYVKLKSGSTKQHFVLAIRQLRLAEPSFGLFNTYGLSKIATVPHF